jgi:L-ribulose-5-phosphate 3-epimerase
MNTRERYHRRQFLKKSACMAAGLTAMAVACGTTPTENRRSPLFEISLAQWSLHRTLFGTKTIDLIKNQGWSAFGAAIRKEPDSVLQGDLDPLDFAKVARQDYGVDAIEYVNTFFFGRARDEGYLTEMKNRADGEGVASLLIMCDAVGDTGDPDPAARKTAIENHHSWVDAAAFLGCHSIRVNAGSSGTYEEQQKLAAEGLHELALYGDTHNINILVENHGGLSSNGKWLAGVMEMADHPRVGTLPDFGNFRISDTEMYDYYQGVEELMPYAKGVSAKSYDFDAAGDETTLDFRRLLKIVVDSGFKGHVDIEYEGDVLGEPEGIRATKALLEKIRDELS